MRLTCRGSERVGRSAMGSATGREDQVARRRVRKLGVSATGTQGKRRGCSAGQYSRCDGGLFEGLGLIDKGSPVPKAAGTKERRCI